MTKLEFMATTGYSGMKAVVNKALVSKFSRLSGQEIMKLGFLRASLCDAIWEANKNPAALETWLKDFNEFSGYKVSIDTAKRTLGVFKIPEPTVKVLKI